MIFCCLFFSSALIWFIPGIGSGQEELDEPSSETVAALLKRVFDRCTWLLSKHQEKPSTHVVEPDIAPPITPNMELTTVFLQDLDRLKIQAQSYASQCVVVLRDLPNEVSPEERLSVLNLNNPQSVHGERMEGVTWHFAAVARVCCAFGLLA